MMKTHILLAIGLIATSFSSHAVVIKKSTSGICHAPDSSYYDKTSNFTPFNSLEQCLKTPNARLPKGYASTSDYKTISMPPIVEYAPTNTPSQAVEWVANDTMDDEFIHLTYSGFDIWLNCDMRGAEHFAYDLTKDTNNLPRRDDFDLDGKVPSRCQQKKTDTYKKRGQMWHRGHQVPANNLDDNARGIYESNYMTNILPQTGTMNTGAWYQTEYITECYRDISDISIYGGVIWGNDKRNDHFVWSHGVITPDAFYKIIVRHDTNETIAWIIPNDFEAKKSKIDNYLTSVDTINKLTHKTVPVAENMKSKTLSRSWSIPKGCGRG
jgi:endonuclease G